MKGFDENLELYIETIFNKDIKKIKIDELSQIEIVPLIGKRDGNIDEESKIDFSELKMFQGLKKLNIFNAYIDKNDIKQISNLKKELDISFRQCMFENNSINYLKHVRNISFEKCDNMEYNFLRELQNVSTLRIISPTNKREINLNILLESMQNSLKKLVLEKCHIIHFDAISRLKEINYLSLLWTDLPKNYVSIINSLENLKKLYISKEYNSENFNKKIEVKNDLAEFIMIEEEEI